LAVHDGLYCPQLARRILVTYLFAAYLVIHSLCAIWNLSILIFMQTS